MIVDPSLARALRQAYWKYTNDQATQTQKELAEVIARHKPQMPFSQKGFRRFAAELSQRIPKSGLAVNKLEGRRQFVACLFLDHNLDAEFNEWHEHVLVAYKFIFYRDALQSALTKSVARIGEHAVQRLFQRGAPRIKGKGEFALEEYSDDIRSAIAWAEMLWPVTDMLEQIHKKKSLSVFAPTPSGAFVGQIATNTTALDFRSFISLDKMFPAQRNLWIALREVEKDVGIEHIGLSTLHSLSRHSASMSTILRVVETMDRFPQILLRSPEIPQSYEAFDRTQLEGY